MPTANRAAGHASLTRRAPSSSAESPEERITSAPATPACCARATTSARSAWNSDPARWQWESIIEIRGRNHARCRPDLRVRRLPDTRAGRDVLIEADESRLAAFRAGGEDHAVRVDSHQLRRLEVEDHDDRPADELFRLVRFGDAGDQRALLGADVDGHLHELARVRHLFRAEHF